MSPPPTLTAFRTRSPYNVPIVPAPRWREWMNATDARFANRCLPLLIANEAGWALLNPHGFEATWDGRDHREGVKIEWDESNLPAAKPVSGHFGYGVITWAVPYIFRTPPGWNLLARGPANWPRDAVSPLEGLVETDWAPATFTMNWKLTRPGQPVRFERGDPFCMVVPERRGELESFSPSIEPLELDTEFYAEAKRWAESRHQVVVRTFLAEFSKDFEADRNAWEQRYFKGLLHDGTSAPEHQTKLRLAKFVEADSTEADPGSGDKPTREP